MSVTKRRLRVTAAVALVASVALGTAAACGNDDNPPAGEKPTSLTVNTFGEFGYDDLVKQWGDENGIDVKLNKVPQLGDYTPQLVRWLATGKGAGDIVAIEEGIITRFNPANFVDLMPYVGDISGEYLPWKYQLGVAPNGKLFGLPTDVGSLAVCYRSDLFAAAGLPTDRDEVSALWPTWDDFVTVAQEYRAKTDSALLDSITTAMASALVQTGGEIYYDKDYNLYQGDGTDPEDLVAAHSPAVKAAWDLAKTLVEGNATAKITTWSTEWTEGFKTGTFAATLCPSWMTGIVQDNSGAENAGKWDIASVPGKAGNWGGSWLAVPTQSKYPEWAAKLARFLTDKDGQIAAFKAKGPLPTNLAALDDPDFQAFTNDYFSGAPTGKIFGESVKAIQPVVYGPRHADIREQASDPAAQAYEKGTLSFEEAWNQFLNDVPIKGAF